MGRPKADTQRVTADAVLGVLDAFLDWCQNHKAGRTYDWYRDYLESFARTIPQGLTTARLKPFHVQQWLDANPGWKTGKRGAVIAVQRAFNWAVRMGRSIPIRSAPSKSRRPAAASMSSPPISSGPSSPWSKTRNYTEISRLLATSRTVTLCLLLDQRFLGPQSDLGRGL